MNIEKRRNIVYFLIIVVIIININLTRNNFSIDTVMYYIFINVVFALFTYFVYVNLEIKNLSKTGEELQISRDKKEMEILANIIIGAVIVFSIYSIVPLEEIYSNFGVYNQITNVDVANAKELEDENSITFSTPNENGVTVQTIPESEFEDIYSSYTVNITDSVEIKSEHKLDYIIAFILMILTWVFINSKKIPFKKGSKILYATGVIAVLIIVCDTMIGVFKTGLEFDLLFSELVLSYTAPLFVGRVVFISLVSLLSISIYSLLHSKKSGNICIILATALCGLNFIAGEKSIILTFLILCTGISIITLRFKENTGDEQEAITEGVE